jgi:putative endonuclease
MALYVYILHCSDDSYYVGITDDPERRLGEHQDGKYPDAYTITRRPVRMVHCEFYPNGTHLQANAREKQLKKWTRAKKEALIQGRVDEISKLAECKNESHAKNHGLQD